MNLNNILQEELKDVPIKEKLYHRTNIENFMDIIKDGYLIGFNNYTKEKEHEDKSEIATARKSTFSTLDAIAKKDSKKSDFETFNLSENIGKIEFILFKDRIVGSHLTRGIKRRPIAEIPITSFKEVRHMTKFIDSKRYKDLEKDLLKLKVINKKNIVDVIKKYRPDVEDISYFFEKEIYYLNIEIARIKDYIVNREGEERFFRKKEIKIPLNDKLMRIKFLNGIEQELKDLSMEERETLQDFVLKNKDLFIKNNNRDKVVSL